MQSVVRCGTWIQVHGRAAYLRVALAALVALALFSAGAPSRAAPIFDGRVVGVIDGDTIVVLTPDRRRVKVRLAEIDAPEHDQPWGQRSKQALSDLVFAKSIRVQVVTTDRYGRTVGRLHIGGKDINAQMVRQGAAWAYRQYLTDPSMLTFERDAKLQHVGLWSLPASQTVPPWEWRHGPRRLPAERREAAQNTFPRTQSDRLACGSKRYCREMESCEEARFYLKQCGLARLDGDGDGVPCESICRPR